MHNYNHYLWPQETVRKSPAIRMPLLDARVGNVKALNMFGNTGVTKWSRVADHFRFLLDCATYSASQVDRVLADVYRFIAPPPIQDLAPIRGDRGT